MSHAPERLYQLPDGVNQSWNGSHWVPGPPSVVVTGVEPEWAAWRSWFRSGSAIASSWRRAQS